MTLAMAESRSPSLLASDPNVPFYQLIDELIRTPDLHDTFKANSERRRELFERTEETIAAFNAGEPGARKVLHKSLGSLYEMHLYGPDKRETSNQFDPTLLEIQRELERAWMVQEEARVPNLEIPDDAREYADWLKQMVLAHPATDHPLFSFLENEATFDQMAEFFLNEITVDARFDDLVALAQIGVDNHAKLELAENYWDELGNGTYDLIHTVMFDNLLGELKVTAGANVHDLFSKVGWEALACGNLLLWSVLHRRNVYVALGALGALEMIAPLRFSRLVHGFERLGLSEKAKQYHTLHVAIDARHGNGWLRNAITPLSEGRAQARREILKGVYFRLNTSGDHCETLYQQFTGSLPTA
jgi:hypothetical protein